MAINEGLGHVYITGDVSGTVDLNPSGGGGTTSTADIYVLELDTSTGSFVDATFEVLPNSQSLSVTTGGAALWEVAITETVGSDVTGYRWNPTGLSIPETDVALSAVAFTDFTGFPTYVYGGFSETSTPYGFSVNNPPDKDCMIVGFDEVNQPRWLINGASVFGGSCKIRSVTTKGHILQVVGEVSSLGAVFSSNLVSGCATFL